MTFNFAKMICMRGEMAYDNMGDILDIAHAYGLSYLKLIATSLKPMGKLLAKGGTSICR